MGTRSSQGIEYLRTRNSPFDVKYLGIRMSYLTSGTGTSISAFRYFSFDISLGFPKWCPVVVMDFMPAVSQWIFYSTTSTDCLGLKVRHVIPNQLPCSKLQIMIEQVRTQNICIDSQNEVNHLRKVFFVLTPLIGGKSCRFKSMSYHDVQII